MSKIIIRPRDRLAWHTQIALSSVPPVAVRVAVIVGSHFNNRTGLTFIGLDKLARLAGVSRRTTWTMIRKLAADGHLAVTKGGGRGRANEYRMILKSVQSVALFDASKTMQKRARNSATNCTPTLTSPSEKDSLGRPAQPYVLQVYSSHWRELLAWYESRGDNRIAELMRKRAESGSGMWTAPKGWRPSSETSLSNAMPTKSVDGTR